MAEQTETQTWRAWGASLLAQVLRLVQLQHQHEQHRQAQQPQEQRSPLQGGEGTHGLLDVTERVRFLQALHDLRPEMDPGTTREAQPTPEQASAEQPQNDLAQRLQALRHRLQDRQQGTSQDRGQEMER